MLVGWIDGIAEGLDDVADDLRTHSRLPAKSSSFSDKQHLAMSHILVFLELRKHSEM